MNTQLPQWSFWATFAVGTAWTILQLVGHIARSLGQLANPVKLECQLTPAFFWRLTDAGELVFPNTLLFSLNGSCLLTNIDFKLYRISESAPAEFTLFYGGMGTLLPQAGQPLGDHFFHSASPLSYIAEGSQERNVHSLKIEDRSSEISIAWKDFANVAAARVREYEESSDPEKQASVLKDSLTILASRAADGILSLMRLEAGSYRLESKASYSKVIGYRKRMQFAYSSITFVVEEDFVNKVREELIKTLSTAAWKLHLREDSDYIYPVYEPIQIKVSQPVALLNKSK